MRAPLTYRAHKVFYYKLKKKTPESIKRLAFTSPFDLSPKTDTRFSNTYAYYTPIIKVNRPIGPFFIPWHICVIDRTSISCIERLSRKRRRPVDEDVVGCFSLPYVYKMAAVDRHEYDDVFTIERAIFGNWDKTRAALKWRLYRKLGGVSTLAQKTK